MKLIAPQFVKPYVKTNKTDANDAEAICEAMSRPSMRFVAVKTVEQQDLQAVHRVRSSLIRERTAKANQLRGLVYEYGLVAPRGSAPCAVRCRSGWRMPTMASRYASGRCWPACIVTCSGSTNEYANSIKRSQDRS